MSRPDLSRVPEFYHNYINQVPENNLAEAFQSGFSYLIEFLDKIPAGKHDYRYAEGKWSLKEVLQHIIDSERVFSYRALRFARKDTTPLPGFDENLFVSNAKTENRNWDDLVREMVAVRKSTEALFASFDEEQLESAGIASGGSNYVLGIGFICVGHCIHHLRIVSERYL